MVLGTYWYIRNSFFCYTRPRGQGFSFLERKHSPLKIRNE